MTFQWGPLVTTLVGIFATAALTGGGWMVSRIIKRIDALGAAISVLDIKLAVVEAKQDINANLNAATARKVGVPASSIPTTLEQENS